MPDQNLIPNEPELIDLLNLLKKDIMLNLSTHHVGIIRSFSPAKQTAEIEIAYTQTHFQPNAITGAYEATYVDYPVLLDCPVVFLGGGGVTGGSITFPVATGDECIVLFNDRDIDNWFQGTGSTAPASLRLHSLSDGFALVGIRSLQNVLPAFQNDRASLRYGTDVEVSAKASKVLIKNASKSLGVILTTLIDKLTDLDTAINKLVTQTAAISVTGVTGGPPTGLSGPPSNALQITAVSNDITAVTNALAQIKTDLGGLLE